MPRERRPTMAMPFPGMDPYLEHPWLWFGFHHSFVCRLMAQMQPLLNPRYVARLKERVYRDLVEPSYVRRIKKRAGSGCDAPLLLVTLPPDDPTVCEVAELYIDIIDCERNFQTVTNIEVIGPANKRIGP